jgi:hypothetical protein
MKVVEAASSAAGALPTTSKLASHKDARADLIYQQQRFVVCQTDSASCTK